MIDAFLQQLDTLLLFVFGLFALAGAIAMLVLRHPMRVAMSLVATMISLGGIYGLLGVHFLAAFQVLIYVSAVMVFIVYVIMLLDVRDLSFTKRFSPIIVPTVVAALVFFGSMAVAVWRETGTLKAPTAPYGIGQFSIDFLQRYWLQFEVTSVLLLAAVVAAVVVVRVDRKSHG
jgi:NADH-quinone oxidoreductase subunit J